MEQCNLGINSQTNSEEITINNSVVYKILKRIIGALLAIIALILLMPLLIIVSVAIRIESKGPAIFKQTRCGKNGKHFTMYKFRSMYIDAEKRLAELSDFNEADGPAFKMHNDPRMTRVGKLLRRTSIDELPQLINIINGTMAWIGPRPALPMEVAQYTEHQKLRLLVTPGLSCYWQISGRSNIAFDEWVELDIKYIKEQSLYVDLIIMLKTIPAVIKADGAY